MSDRPVFITGLGPVCSIGIGADAFWQALCQGRCGVEKITRFDTGGFATRIAGEIRDFKCRDYVPRSYRKSIKVMAKDIEFAVAAADTAVRHAGLITKAIDEENPKVDPRRLGVNIGAGVICADLTELADALARSVDDDGNFSLTKWGNQGMENLTPLWLLKYLPNMLACHVTIIHDAQATSNTITCAEASSALAVGEAFRTIARGAVDACLCGGAETKLNPMGMLRQHMFGFTTKTHNDSPATAVRPFDKDRDGSAIGEGGGVIVLEAEDHASARDAKIYGRIAGFGAAFDGNMVAGHNGKGKAIEIAANTALKDAGISPDDIDLVAAFAAGLPQHDLNEAAALTAVFNGRDVPVMAIKGQIGCCGAGAGALDLIAGVLAMQNGHVPATANCDQLDPQCQLYVVRKAQNIKINTLLTTSYSLIGGQAAALVIDTASKS